MWVEALKEGATDTKRTSARDGLGDGDVVKDPGGSTVGKGCSCLGKSRYTGDAGILLIEIFEDDAFFGGADGREDIRLANVVTVGADSEVYLIRKGVGFEGFGNTWEVVNRVAGAPL